MRWRWKYIERLTGVDAHHARYFCSLDEATDPDCVLAHPALQPGQGGLRLQRMGQIAQLLKARLLSRASGKLDGPPFDSRSARLAGVREAVVQWSRIQLDLLHSYYGTPESSLDLQQVEMAYLMFASGRLRVPLANRRGPGEPDSAFYFAFAEFALLAGELGVETEPWNALLRPLVWTQGVFVHMQRPVGPKPHLFHQYAPRGRERVFTPEVAAAARATVLQANSRAELADVHSANCMESFA